MPPSVEPKLAPRVPNPIPDCWAVTPNPLEAASLKNRIAVTPANPNPIILTKFTMS